jgi:hypothetical protein
MSYDSLGKEISSWRGTVQEEEQRSRLAEICENHFKGANPAAVAQRIYRINNIPWLTANTVNVPDVMIPYAEYISRRQRLREAALRKKYPVEEGNELDAIRQAEMDPDNWRIAEGSRASYITIGMVKDVLENAWRSAYGSFKRRFDDAWEEKLRTAKEGELSRFERQRESEDRRFREIWNEAEPGDALGMAIKCVEYEVVSDILGAPNPLDPIIDIYNLGILFSVRSPGMIFMNDRAGGIFINPEKLAREFSQTSTQPNP